MTKFRRYYKNGDVIILAPKNKKYEPMILNNNDSMIGIAKHISKTI